MTITTQQRPLPAGIVGVSQMGPAARQEYPDGASSGTLLVGQGIQVKGEIGSCQNLTVEGRVEASLDAETLRVLKDGFFKGTAVVDKADIAGTFEGTLEVRGQLSIKGTGRVAGTVRYERITIEGGGQLAGDVSTGEDTDAAAKGHVA